MRLRYRFLCASLGLGLPLAAQAQQPFEKLGVTVKILSLSNGRYPEYFSNDSLRRIGTVVYNTRLKRVAYLLPGDSLVGRVASEVTSRWLTVDPLAEKFAHISPYVYVSNNPLRFNDPDGRAEKDVILGGSQKQAAFQQLQSSVSKSLTLSMDASGKVSYTETGKHANKGAKQLMNAIDNHAVTVNVTSENTKVASDGNHYVGGAFMGNTVGKAADGSNVVQTQQEVNPQVTGAFDAYYSKPGRTVLHEVVESYLGGAKSQKTGIASGTGNDPQNYYMRSHIRAPSQPGQVYDTYFDGTNSIVPDGDPSAKRIEYTVQEGNRPPQVIMTFP